jgi:hypothetical protein
VILTCSIARMRSPGLLTAVLIRDSHFMMIWSLIPSSRLHLSEGPLCALHLFTALELSPLRTVRHRRYWCVPRAQSLVR